MTIAGVNIIVCYRGFLAMGTSCNLRTCFTVVSSISRFTVTAITSWKVDTGSFVLAWSVGTFVNICKQLGREIIFSKRLHYYNNRRAYRLPPNPSLTRVRLIKIHSRS